MKKFTLIHFFIILGNVAIPGSAVLLALLFPKAPYRWLFAGFMVFHAIERVWETFFTSKEKKAHEFHGDWTLAWVTATYIALCFVLIFEFFCSNYQKSVLATSLGLIFYIGAFRIRWWGMATLGSQWSIHAVGAIKLDKYRLVKIGAYKYMRHPIYAGIILEELGLALIASAYIAFIFALLICVPLVFVRASIEEQSSIRKFGDEYRRYCREVDMIFPLKVFRKMRIAK